MVLVSVILIRLPLSSFFSPSSSSPLFPRPRQLLKHGSTSVLWEPDLLQLMETVETRGREGLGEEAALALRLLLSQVTHSDHPGTYRYHIE